MRSTHARHAIFCLAAFALLAPGAAPPPAKPKWVYLWGSGTVKVLGQRDYHVHIYRAPPTGGRFTGHITFDLGLRAQKFEFEGRTDGDRVTLTVKPPRHVHPHSPVTGGGKYEGSIGGDVFAGKATLNVIGRGGAAAAQATFPFTLRLFPPILGGPAS